MSEGRSYVGTALSFALGVVFSIAVREVTHSNYGLEFWIVFALITASFGAGLLISPMLQRGG